MISWCGIRLGRLYRKKKYIPKEANRVRLGIKSSKLVASPLLPRTIS
ncbi:hypothetical protein [Candidatus Liberibacter solanacearum]|nr:hypothetical protein [Candidatus Liberibacter solanacearum]